jgi:hypothetical protein
LLLFIFIIFQGHLFILSSNSTRSILLKLNKCKSRLNVRHCFFNRRIISRQNCCNSFNIFGQTLSMNLWGFHHSVA